MNTSASAACALLSMAAGVFHVHSWAGMANGNVAIQDLTPNSSNSLEGTMGVCWALLNPGAAIDTRLAEQGGGDGHELGVRESAFSLFSQGPGKDPSLLADYSNAKVTILQTPKYGALAQSKYSPTELSYFPKLNYVGNDKAVFLVDIEGHLVKVIYYFKVVRGSDPAQLNDKYNKYCPPPNVWKISQSDFNFSTQDYAAWLRSSELTSLLATASQSFVGFQDLAGSSVGQTTGEGANAAIKGKGSGLVLRQHYPLPQPAHPLYCLQITCYALSSNKPRQYADKRPILHKNEGFGLHRATPHRAVRVVKMDAQNG